ncbi:universal stress protein [Alkalilacustris brevis]|uniref:universal stress protein n=1 Tax=Alkalilacustris brevis TaxID=2026338 RepID=UPI000E0DDEC2|nr:universal stress protein [Alkalilacustris brevis]
MAYKTLATFISDPDSVAPALEASVALARREDAHLDVCCLGVDHTQPGHFYAGAPAMIYQETLDRAREEAEELEAEVRKRLGREDIRWGVETAVVQLGGLSSLVGLRARFSDLVIQPKPYEKGRPTDAEAIVEAALFDGQAPVLIVPEAGIGDTLGQRITVAWNQSDEALSAVRRALPLLVAAEHVDIVIIDPPAQGPERSDPGGLLTQMLTRHGVRAEVSVLARTMPKISEILQRHVREHGSDMLVMGAYGHSRFREAILGGATRNMLELAETPVFMAH